MGREYLRFMSEILEKLRDRKEYKNIDFSIFFARFGNNFEILFNNFRSLYGDRKDFAIKLEELMFVVQDFYVKRDERLKKIDLEREKEPDWFLSNNWVEMMLYIDRFSKDLKGFKERISYLKDLGINIVHFMPLLQAREGENDGGYAVSDYTKIDSKFGDMKDLKDILKIFRKENMLLELDLVLNHTADTHDWAKRALDGDKKYQDYYYMYNNREIPDKFEESLPEVFPKTAPGNFTYNKEINKWIFTVFNNYQWDLNYTNPDLFIEMTKILLFLANVGIDILRLDAVAFLWKRIGTNSQNLPEAHTILQMFKACAKIVAPGVVFKAEAIVQPVEIVKYLGEGDLEGKECDIAYNASFMVFLWDAIATKNTKLLQKGLEHMPRLPKGTTWVNYIRCHDDIGLGFSDLDAIESGYNPVLHRKFLLEYYTGKFYGSMASGIPFMYNPKTGDARISGELASLCGLEKSFKNKNFDEIEKSIEKIILLHSAIMSFGGIPLIYYGDELGMTNDYSYELDEEKKDDNRWIHRPVIDEERLNIRKKMGSIENRIFENIKKLIKIRKNTPEFYGENNYKIVGNDNLNSFIFIKEHKDSKIMVIMNFSDREQEIEYSILMKNGFFGEVIDKFTNKIPEIRKGKIIIKRYQFYWLKEKENRD
ncbi:alpha-amylase family protein [Haliovirga abyssi]|uniref:Alpha-amylase n=1 Tax=Haliovirga abyssi TaxID=2996794 RepID=A0AAU9DA20_9FUSO|nr:alpha-amylase family protein [Haliovirga abyssi]BDU50170.1 alpha-amylase [Haliovirga abyssi]